MSEKKDAEGFEFHLKILSVKMKMKFPCRMALEYQKQPITKQSASTDQNKFIFNEVITLHGEDGQAFQILASLYTEKGTKYTSGSMKLLSAELLRSKGERLVIPLMKCLDPDAFCELVVEGVKDLKDYQLKMSRSSSKVITSPEKAEIVSPLPKKINSQRVIIGETRSQANFHPLVVLGSEDRPRDTGPKSQVFKTFTRSPNSKFSTIKYATYNGNNLGVMKSDFPIEEGNSHRTSFDQGEVYRQGYLKLKEKFKRESELLKQESRKRAALEANQNTLRLDLIKLKVKGQELEKQLADRNQKLKALTAQITELQKKDLDLAYVREECSSLDRKCKMQEDTITALISDNDSLKKLMVEKSTMDAKALDALRQELQLAKNLTDEIKYQYELQFKAKDSIILTKNNDVQLRNQTIDRQKRLIKELEQQSEARALEFERTLAAQRNILQLKITDHISKLASIEGQKDGLEQKNAFLEQEIEKLKATVSTLEFNKKILAEEAAQTGVEVADLKVVRQKYSELLKEHRFLEQQFTTVRKNLESTLQNKEVNLSDLLKQYEEGKERNEKFKAEQQEKIKLLLAKNIAHEATIIGLNNSLDKAKRINDSLAKENSSLREQNKLIRQDLKSTQRKYITLENQHSTFSHRYDRQSSALKAALERAKEEKNAAQSQVETLNDKYVKLAETLKEYEEKEGQWKIKQRHSEQKIEKEINKAKDLATKFETIIEDQKHIIKENISNIDSLNLEHRNLKKKIGQLELTAIRDRETCEKLKHSLKLSEEKILNLEQVVRHRDEQERQNQERIAALETNIAEKQHQIVKFKEKEIEWITKTKKQTQISDMLNKEVNKLQKGNEQLKTVLKTKEENQERLRQSLKDQKEEVVKEKMKTAKIESDFDKFKESISDIIRIQFTRILNTPTTTQKNTERLRESQVSNGKSERSHKSRVALDAGNLSSSLLQKLHQTKSSLWKMVELNRFLKEENGRLLTHTENESNKYEFAQLELHRDIQLLEDEMNNLMSDKEAECQNYDQLLIDLNFRIKEKETEIEDLKAEIAEYEAIVNGMKTDFEANNDLNNKKVSSLKLAASELQQRVDYLNLNVACLQDKNHELQEKIIEQEAEIIACKEMLIKGEKALQDISENQAKLITSLESYKKELKIIQEKYIQLDMLCNSEKEAKEKYATMLEEEQKKCQKLNQFVNRLIIQKQAAIKKELQKAEENNQLQNQLFDLTHERDLLQEQNQTLKKKLEESKEEAKSHLKSIKIFERQLSEEKTKCARSIEKVKERESDLQIKKEYIKDLQDKFRQLRDKNYKEIRELSNQLQGKNLITINISKQLNDKILKVETESKKRWEEAHELQEEVERLTKQLYDEKDRSEDLIAQLTKVKEEKVSFEQELLSREYVLQERSQEINRLQDVIGELKQQIRNFQSQCEAQEKEFNHHFEQLSNDYNYKLDEITKEYTHNQNLLQEENKQLRAKIDVTEQQLHKVQLELNAREEEHTLKINTCEERLKKIENDRMINIQAKNNQIKKIAQESKATNDKLRQKETEVRKLTLQIEKAKIQETELQAKIAQSVEKAKNREKVMEREIEGLKNKEKLANENKLKLLANIHENETQVRKLINEAVKKIIQGSCKADSEKISSVMRNLESSVAQALVGKLSKE